MKRLVVLIVLLSLCAPLFAAEPGSASEDQVRGLAYIVVTILLRLVRVFEAAIADPAIGPRLRGEMEEAADEFTGILEFLGVPVARVVPGIHG